VKSLPVGRASWLPCLLLALPLAALGCGSESAETASGATGAASGTGGGAGGEGGGAAADCVTTDDGETLHLAAGNTMGPGDERTMCARWTTPEDLDITAFVGTLGPAGHHALLLAIPGGTAPDGVAPCSEAELMDAQTKGAFQLLAGVSYESDGVRYDFPSSPVQIGLVVPAGTQLVFDAHFLQAGAETVEACATIDLVRGAPVYAPLTFRTYLPEEQYTLQIPPKDQVDVTYDMPAGGHFRVAAASSHMHAGGTHFRLSIAETGKVLHETDEWSDPTPTLYPVEKVVIEEGQTLRLECSFDNPSDVAQHFPDQMCVGGMYTLSCAYPGAC